jgi:hypothetical protein
MNGRVTNSTGAEEIGKTIDRKAEKCNLRHTSAATASPTWMPGRRRRMIWRPARKSRAGRGGDQPLPAQADGAQPVRAGPGDRSPRRLDYPRCRWFDRAIIRGIIRVTGGPTDSRTSVVYGAGAACQAGVSDATLPQPARKHFDLDQ